VPVAVNVRSRVPDMRACVRARVEHARHIVARIDNSDNLVLADPPPDPLRDSILIARDLDFDWTDR